VLTDALAIWLGAFGACAAVWPFLHGQARVRNVALLMAGSACLLLPWLYPPGRTVLRALVILFCSGFFAPKLWDAYRVPHLWLGQSFVAWIVQLLNPFQLIYRPHWVFPVTTRRQNLLMLLRGVLEVAAGVAILRWALLPNREQIPFLLEHSLTVLAAYLLGFDGGFVLLCGLGRTLGVRMIDLSRDPILAVTPADFWRRYNRNAAQFLCEDVFKPLGGRRHPRQMIMATFLINGLGHEYLAWQFVGSICGYQTLFFAIHGVAAAFTYDVHPRTVRSRVMGRSLTLILLFVTSILFFHSIGWYFTLRGGS
jgi:hypothetical protein